MSGPADRQALGIDAGGSGTRWLLVGPDGRERASGSVGPISGHVFNPAVREASLEAVDILCRAVCMAGRPERVAAGITGLGPEGSLLFQARLAERLDVAAHDILMSDDMGIAYRSCFEPGEGILVYSGTGSIGYHLTADLAIERAGGHGFIIDDAGSGFWIARNALRWTVRRMDEAPSAAPTRLMVALTGAIGGTGWDAIRAFVYGGDRGRIAGLAPAVADAARAGDEIAFRILHQSGRKLARLARVLLERLGPRAVVLSGGAASLDPVIFESFRAVLPRDLDVRHATIEPVRAAAALARKGHP